MGFNQVKALREKADEAWQLAMQAKAEAEKWDKRYIELLGNSTALQIQADELVDLIMIEEVRQYERERAEAQGQEGVILVMSDDDFWGDFWTPYVKL